MRKAALITGITGQDGRFLAELLLAKGYEVFGLVRRHSSANMDNIAHLLDKVQLLSGDVLDFASVANAVVTSEPTEVYNLAAQSFVGVSWQQPLLTASVTGLGALNVFEAVRQHKSDARVYQASSSEMFGNAAESPQRETTPFRPRSPYGAAKVFAHHAAVNYRESHGMFISCGILFNHESLCRGPEFVTRKVTMAVARIHLGLQKELHLGDLGARRDWGYAPEYVRAMWQMLQFERPLDLVIATGQSHSVRDWVEAAFKKVGLDWREYVRSDVDLKRPAEIHDLVGDPSKAKRLLGWSPSVTFEGIVDSMVTADLLRFAPYEGDPRLNELPA